MKTIRASEIGSYCYCERAWWYMRQGYSSEDQVALREGTELHALHGNQAMQARKYNALSILLFILAAGVLIVWTLGQIL